MRIFIFKSASNPTLRAFAGTPGGDKLPSKLGPWHAIGVIRAENAPRYNVPRDVIEKAIADQGFQLFREKPKTAAGA